MSVLEHHAPEAVADRVPEVLPAALPPGARGELVVDLELQHAAGRIACFPTPRSWRRLGGRSGAASCASCAAPLSRGRRAGAVRSSSTSPSRQDGGSARPSSSRSRRIPTAPPSSAVSTRSWRRRLPAARARPLRERPAGGRRRRLGAAGAAARRRPPSRVTPARLLALAEDLARAHAALLGRAPEWLPRPFGRDARARLAHVEEGAARLRERMRTQAGAPLPRERGRPRGRRAPGA